MKKHSIFLVIIAFLLSNCYSDAVVDLPENKPLVAINAINFQPDSTWLIELTKSESYYHSGGALYIEDAVVKIEDEEGVTIQLSPVILQNRLVYKSDHRPLENKLYKLTVDAPGYPVTKATSKIPEPVKISRLEIDSAFFIEQKQALALNSNHVVDYSKPMQCKLIISDPAAEANYYDIRLYLEGKIEYTNTEGEIVTKVYFVEYPLINLDYSFASLLTDDTKFNGLQYAIQFNLPFYLFFSPIGNMHIVLTTLNSDRYKYMQTVNLQNTSKHDPFAQPVIIHNNIENGVGVFAGFSKSVWVLEKPTEDD